MTDRYSSRDKEGWDSAGPKGRLRESPPGVHPGSRSTYCVPQSGKGTDKMPSLKGCHLVKETDNKDVDNE